MVTAHARAVCGVDGAGAGRTTKISVSLFLDARSCSRQVRFFWGARTHQPPPVTRAGAIYILCPDPAYVTVTPASLGNVRTPARLLLPVLRADADVLHARYVLVQM